MTAALFQDANRQYPEECQFAKEIWREKYFRAQLKEETKTESNDAKEAEWNELIQTFRKKAVKRD